MNKKPLPPLVGEFLAALAQDSSLRPLFTPESKLVVGVSGGPDSLALLHLLAREGLHPAENLIAAHLDHGLRPSSAAEADFVAKTAQAWGVAARIGRSNVVEVARSEGLSLEEAARAARYRFLGTIADELGAGVVAVAHHADDQAETVLMHFLRGTGLAGLRGMRPVSPMPGALNLTLIRPLLAAGRDEILAYCEAHELRPVVDESNTDITFFRNRLRHELLPLLEAVNPRLRERLVHGAAVMAADEELLSQLAEQAWADVRRGEGAGWLEMDRAGWLALPLSLRRRLLRQAVFHLRPALRDVTFRPVEQARIVAEQGEIGTQSTLPGNVTLTVGYDSLQLAMAGAAPEPDLPQLPENGALVLPIPGRVALAHGWHIEARLLPAIQTAMWNGQPPDPWTVHLDAADLGPLAVRPRRPGEQFRPLGMEGHSATVKEVMINHKIPAGLRGRWPIVAGENHLLWIVGHHLDERQRVTADSYPILQLCAFRL